VAAMFAGIRQVAALEDDTERQQQQLVKQQHERVSESHQWKVMPVDQMVPVNLRFLQHLMFFKLLVEWRSLVLSSVR
jgi:hypothetical protein